MPSRDSIGSPEWLCETPLIRDGDSAWSSAAGRLPVQDGTVTIIVLFDASGYPLERHCRYARSPAPDGPRTFVGLEFAETPPGLRVGPWPGWRGIPEMPAAQLVTGDRRYSLRFEWWGDELRLRRIRGVCSFVFKRGDTVSVVPGDPALVPLSAVWYRVTPRTISPLPVRRLPELAGMHPCLLITQGDLRRLRADTGEFRRRAKEQLRALLLNKDLPFLKTPESKVPPGPERLQSEDIMMISALLALVDPGGGGGEVACEAYRRFFDATRSPGYGPLQVDTQAGETLFLLCLGFDWLHPFFDEQSRATFRSWLGEVAGLCADYLPPSRSDVAQAHYLGCGLGLLAFSFLFWDDHPRAATWAAQLRGALAAILPMLPEDGFHPHGGNLWIYEYGFLLRWLELFRICAGEHLWNTTPHWREASKFRAAMSTPDAKFGITFGDPQYRIGGDSWCHDLIAARTGSTVAQWLGDRLRDGEVEGIDVRHGPPRRRVYEFLYRATDAGPGSPPEGILAFHDGGQVFARSGAGVCTVRSGPPLGWRRRKAGEYGAYGHSDPANGALLLYKDGAFLLSGPGPVYRRDTSLHNLTTVNGIGQLGDGTVWLPDFYPPGHIAESPTVEVAGGIATIRMELSAAYLPDAGIRNHVRSVLVDENLRIAVADLIRCDGRRAVALHLHTWCDFRFEEGEPALRFSVREGRRVLASLAVAGSRELRWSTAKTEFVPAYPHDGRRDSSLVVLAEAEDLLLLWCLCGPDESFSLPVPSPGATATFRLGHRTVTFSGTEWKIGDGRQ